ncbi:FAD-binding oxidoreductase [Aquella oligotrophica]|uniref:Hydroxyacid dehydrogenase n=1 Tax=Aquella oligotrophica TaxID=2067065 RepID=A0A2I7N6T4_9NEIS|nr:FAD-binding oxidoreductase [Aquella oligotrophica]AUR52152.1 hydroxyacid dehydrogenase [Aquella oligotrophica]
MSSHNFTETHLAKFREICGNNNVVTKPELMSAHLTDWRKRYSGNAIAILFPENTSQIVAIIKYCQHQKVAITPQGGNTSTCGAATPLANHTAPQIIINLARMNKVIEVDRVNSSVTIEAGCTLQMVQEIAASHNLYFPLTLASQGTCQIGGNLATNAGGTQVLKYGMMRDLTLGLEVVLPNGNIMQNNHKLRKNNTYLDLKQIFIGSEGTLGIITRATLKLFPLPVNYLTFMLPVEKLVTALTLLEKLKHYYLNNVSAFEIIKDDSQKLYNQQFPDAKLPFTANWLLLAELEINADFNLDNFISLLESIGINPDDVLIASNDKQRRDLWLIREHIPLAEKAYGYAVKHDISLPLGKIEEFLATSMPKLRKIEADGYFSIFGHLGDGNLHYNFGKKGASLTDTEALEEQVSQIVYQDVINFGGSIAAEHGIGIAKKQWFKKYTPVENLELLQTLKKQLDPLNLFNPSKIL